MLRSGPPPKPEPDEEGNIHSLERNTMKPDITHPARRLILAACLALFLPLTALAGNLDNAAAATVNPAFQEPG